MPVRTPSIASTTLRDSSSVTSPKMLCLPNSQSVFTVVMKNWEPLVPLPIWTPALAMASLYGALKVSFGVDFVVELVAGSAHAAAEGIAALDHEVLDDPVEDGAVVKRCAGLVLAGLRVGPGLFASGQANEVGNGLGGVVAEKVNLDVAQARVNCGFCCCNGHASHSFMQGQRRHWP